MVGKFGYVVGERCWYMYSDLMHFLMSRILHNYNDYVELEPDSKKACFFGW